MKQRMIKRIQARGQRGFFPVGFRFAVFIAASLLFFQCARQGSPTGGPKDIAPPVVVSETPPNRSINFKATKVYIDFNEFVQLKDISKEIFISPPMRTKPDFKVQGKKIVIAFQEELKPDATYTINFGNAIVDYTEGNVLVNYEYVFATGNHLDSLSIAGQVLDAFDLKPQEGIIAMVYQDDNDTIPFDSLPLRVPPKSASRTTKEGQFSINNLAPGVYKLFALEDLNNNYIYDLPNERIAFLDSLVTIKPPETPVLPIDTIVADTVSADTITADTANSMAEQMKLHQGDYYTLYLFQQADTMQKLLGKKLFGRNLLQYIFNLPADSVKISLYECTPEQPDWYIKEFSSMKDTVDFWLKPVLPDTINVIVSVGDSLSDTSKYILPTELPGKSGKRKDVRQGMKITSNVAKGYLDPNQSVDLRFPLPVISYDTAMLSLWTPTDTLTPLFVFTDSVHRRGKIDFSWQQGDKYDIFIDDSAFSDLSGAFNDSVAFHFKVKTTEDYGVLLLDIKIPDPSDQYIIQLMTDKEVILDQRIITKPEMINIEYLNPGDYKLKAIHDINMNGKWDPGDYSESLLPEPVEYYPAPLSIRANWDFQEEWELKK